MANPDGRAVTFVVAGEDQTIRRGATRGLEELPPPELPITLPGGQLTQSVRVGTAREGGDGAVRVQAMPGKDVVVLDIANGPALVLHPENARDLMLAQTPRRQTRSAAGRVESPDEVEVPVELVWRGLEDATPSAATRGGLGRVLLKAVHVVTGGSAARLAASEIAQAVDGQVIPGVYPLSRDSLPRLKTSGAVPLRAIPPADGQPILVLVHGTFSDTQGTFGKLWAEHPGLVSSLFQHYGDRVYALDHPTLGASPVANARMLAEALPANARVHLVTHSRGGLVAEVLARVSAASDITDEQLGAFKDKDAPQREAVRALAALVKRKAIRVERIARVACPARGTLLASKRLDAYVSVFRWTLQLAGIPVAPELVAFLHSVAQQRHEPDVLPGLAAQIPDSGLIRWLHDVDAPIPGDLRVIAGDLQGDSVASWLKTLLSDAFYWTDNDLVVQTRSMYGGAPREQAGFVLDQGGKVSHFGYFQNERTAEAIVNALVQDAPAGFRAIGPLSWAGESSSGVRAAALAAVDDRPGRDKPALFLLPGILGSNLKVNGRRVWLGWALVNGLDRLAYRAGAADRVEPDGPIDRVYDELGRFLARTHEVIEFGYDWRRPIEQEAVRLALEVTKALDARADTGQPVRILAHSMGGVLARTMALEQPLVWQRMLQHPGARMLMLGTPNAGSWAPMQVLSGDDGFGNLLAMVGAPFRTAAARRLMAGFPGFLQLQAGLLDPERKLSSSETWATLAAEDLRRLKERSWWHREVLQLDTYTWGVPTQQVLDQAVALRRRLEEQRQEDLPRFKDRLSLVTGKARFTPDGYALGEEGLTYLDAEDHGDGRVTLSAAQLPGVATWQLDCTHGDLPSYRDAFEAYLDLLQHGTTDRLKSLSTTTRGAEPTEVVRVSSRPSRGRSSAAPPEGPADLLKPSAAAPLGEGIERDPALRITVHNGDLSFVREPLMLGHYRSLRLTGTEYVMDQLIGHTMTHALKAGLYPDAPGSYQVFVNRRVPEGSPRRLPRPEAVIVVGLGAEGKLEATDLMETVRQGVLAWAQRLAERPGPHPPLFDLAATFIGSGGKGIQVGQSARFIAKGVREANRRLRTMHPEKVGGAAWPRVGHLHLIELYLDRAAEALRELRIEASAAPAVYDVTPTVKIETGALVRPIESGYRGSDYDFMSALTRETTTTDGAIEYTLDTRRARAEVRDQITQKALVRRLVATASNSKASDPRLGVTLCRLLVPLRLDAFLAGTSELLIELDDGTAGIPWELLDTGASDGGDDRPWGIRSKLVRQLRTTEFREEVVDTDYEARALVIGEPAVDSKLYPPLPGAREEAAAVARLLAVPEALGPTRVKALVASATGERGPDAFAIINSLLERRSDGGSDGIGQGWRIVHVAGHGEPPLGRDPRGVVLSGGLFLGPHEVRSMREVPELVFVNCCHIGASDPEQVLQQRASRLGEDYDRVAFASGLARELINLGVRCVVAAGWAVDDTAASTFATTFYRALLTGQRFMDAVAAAREAAFRPDDKTWAAYQCYGDPEWTLRVEPGDDRRPASTPSAEFTAVTSPVGLTLALHTLVVKSESQGTPAEVQRTRLRHLESRFAGSWGAMGHVAAAFGDAWNAAGDRDKAIEWYRKALKANDGSASVRAGEQLGNVLARRAWEAVEKAQRKVDALERDRSASGRAGGSRARRAPPRPSAKLRAARAEVQAAARRARAPIREAIDLLQRVAALRPTMECESLLGSAYKRQAMIAGTMGRQAERNRALGSMRDHYRRALEEGRSAQLGNLFYPGLNLMAAELVLRGRRGGGEGFDPALVADVERTLDRQMLEEPDFWSAAGFPELLLYQALARGALAAETPQVLAAFEDLHRRVSTGSRWASVYDQISFVLSTYEHRGDRAERHAAERLLNTLHHFAREPAEALA